MTTDGSLILTEVVCVPARLENMEQVQAHLARFLAAVERAVDPPPDKQIGYAVITAAMEIAANLARHAYPGDEASAFSLDLRLFADRVEIIFRDCGVEFKEPGNAPAPPMDRLDPLPAGGRGLFLARRAVDELHYVRTPAGVNEWRIVKRLR